MENERLLEILMYNVQMLTNKINVYEERGISQKKIDILKAKKDRYQQAILDLE